MKLQTPRLVLTPFADDHLDTLHALWTDPDVRRYLWDDEIISRQLAAEVIASSGRTFEEHGFGFWALAEIDAPGTIIGFVGLRHFGEAEEIELLYGLAPSHWHRGLATEASRAVLDYGFRTLALDRIHAGTDPPNVASLAVMERLGFGDEQRRVLGGLEAIYRSLTRDAYTA